MNNYELGSWYGLYRVAFVALVLLGATQSGARGNTKALYLAQTPELPPGTNIDNLPAAPLPEERQNPAITPLPPIEDFLDSLPNGLPGEELPESSVEFEVKKFILEGNTVLSEAELESILRQYRDRQIGFADLLALETELTKLYTAKGYLNSGVVVPIQDVRGGVVKLQAIEGMIDQINVRVDGRLKEGYVRSRLMRGANKPLRIAELQEALQLLQLDPLIENINAELSVGT
ncbi:MAG: POTRA domain-containing protein, partial [Cyanobacteria bacterium J06623_1]